MLNLLRPSEAAIDVAMHAMWVGKLELPQGSREAIALLERAGWIELVKTIRDGSTTATSTSGDLKMIAETSIGETSARSSLHGLLKEVNPPLSSNLQQAND